MSNYQADDVLLKLIEHYESLHDGDLTMIGLQPKMDPSGIWTEAWGHAIVNPKTGKFVEGIENKALAYSLAIVKTREEADILLKSDLRPRLYTVNKTGFAKNQGQFNALVDILYNCGNKGLNEVIFDIHNGMPVDAAIMKHNMSKGKVLPGLTSRRKTDILLFNTGVLKFFN